MTQKQLNLLCEHTILSGPLRLINPNPDYFGYLLRCNSLPEEDCTKSIIIYAPDSRFPINRFLPAKKEDRERIRDDWTNYVTTGNFVGFATDPTKDSNGEIYDNLFPTYPSDIQEWAENLFDLCCYQLPSYKIFAVIAHIDQKVLQNGKLYYRSPHIHILMQAFQKETEAESALINENS